jgi:hypothetical protein
MSWTKSESIAKLTEALVKVQSEMKPVARAGHAEIEMKSGKKYKYDFLKFQDVCAQMYPLLAANGLALLQPVAADGAKVHITSILSHVSGEWIADTLTMQAGDTSPQSVGSAITYGRRYGACSLVGIVADEDDDGKAAQPQNNRPQNRARGAVESRPSSSGPAPGAKPEAVASAPPPVGGAPTVQSILARARELNWKDNEISACVKKRFNKGLSSLSAEELSQFAHVVETGEDTSHATH